MAALLRLVFAIAIILPVTLVLAPVQWLLIRLARPWSRIIPLWWHRMVLWLIGVRVHVHGRPHGGHPLMLVSNHVSWADILVLGSVMPLCFIAKDEVKTWPGINWLARLQRTVFVNRENRREVGVQADTIAERLLQGDPMVLFAEGTTGNGDRLLPFKSALFGAPQSAMRQSGLEMVTIQPVALAYSTLHGMPLGRYHQTLAAWPGDIGLGPHLKSFLLQGAFDVDVAFGPPLAFTPETQRKAIAADTFAMVRLLFTRLRRLYHRSERPQDGVASLINGHGGDRTAPGAQTPREPDKGDGRGDGEHGN